MSFEKEARRRAAVSIYRRAGRRAPMGFYLPSGRRGRGAAFPTSDTVGCNDGSAKHFFTLQRRKRRAQNCHSVGKFDARRTLPQCRLIMGGFNLALECWLGRAFRRTHDEFQSGVGRLGRTASLVRRHTFPGAVICQNSPIRNTLVPNVAAASMNGNVIQRLFLYAYIKFLFIGAALFLLLYDTERAHSF